MQKIRTATFEDLDAIAAVEAACFPAAEAATKEEFAGRLTHYADHFWLLFEDEKLVSFVDGFVTDTPDLTDEMYADASLHDAHGAWQMIFGVNTLPEYRKQGLAGQLLRRAIADAKAQGRRGLGSPARTGSCTITPASALSAKAFPAPPTAAWCGTRCG